MFDYTCNNNYNILRDENQYTDKINLKLLKATETGYKLLCGVGSLQNNQRQFAIVYLQTPQGELYPGFKHF